MEKKMQEIFSLSSFIMVDPEYTIFTNYLKQKDFNSARLFLDKLSSELHFKLSESENTELALLHYKRCDKLEDLVLDLFLDGDTEDGETKNKTRRSFIR